MLRRLQAIGAVVGPGVRELHPLAGGDGGGMAHHGDQVLVPTSLDAQHAEAVLGIVVGDPLHQPGQGLCGSGGGVCGRRPDPPAYPAGKMGAGAGQG